MIREAILYFKCHRKVFCDDYFKICPKDSMAYAAILKEKEFYDMAIKALKQEPSRNMEEIAEVIKSDADAETKCKMISNILTAKPHYFKEEE